MSPPGYPILTPAPFARSGPKRSIEARNFSVNSRGKTLFLKFLAEILSFFCVFWIFTPHLDKSWVITATSEISGTLSMVQVSSVKRQAAIIGKTEFLFPAILIRPYSFFPPVISNLATLKIPYVKNLLFQVQIKLLFRFLLHKINQF